MRAGWADFRTPVTWEAKQGNTGDGSTYAAGKTIRARVAGGAALTLDGQGSTLTEPVKLDLPWNSTVGVGDRLTIGTFQVVVRSAGYEYGPFGVIHHRHVEAL